MRATLLLGLTLILSCAGVAEDMRADAGSDGGSVSTGGGITSTGGGTVSTGGGSTSTGGGTVSTGGGSTSTGGGTVSTGGGTTSTGGGTTSTGGGTASTGGGSTSTGGGTVSTGGGSTSTGGGTVSTGGGTTSTGGGSTSTGGGAGGGGAGTGFVARPYLFQADRTRLLASIAANDPEALGSAQNNQGEPIAFITLCRAAVGDRANYNDVPTWHLAFAGWLTNDVPMMQLARNEALAIVSSAPAGDTGHSDTYQHVEERLLNVAATTDLAFGQFSDAQLKLVATWVNGTLQNWNAGNLSYWPFDEPLNNYWQNAFLAHVIAGIATEGFNSQAAAWRTKTVEMAAKFTTAINAPAWAGPVQTEGHYYSSYLKQMVWGMQLYDAAMGTHLLETSNFPLAKQLDMVMFETRPHLDQFFEIGSEPSSSNAPHTGVSIENWHVLIHAVANQPQAAQAKAILASALPNQFWGRYSKGFTNFYFNLRPIPVVPLSAKTDRLFAPSNPGAGMIGLRSSAGFQTSAVGAIMFANKFNWAAAFGHGNPDAPGFQWASGPDWLVTDPEFFSNSGILAEGGSSLGSDVSNIVTLAGVTHDDTGSFPLIVHAEDNRGASVAHSYVQIDAHPAWTATSVYRRDYVWLDDVRVVAIFDRVVAAPAKTWRLHVPAAPTISGSTASYVINSKQVTVRSLFTTNAGAWKSENLNGSVTQQNVWRLSQEDSAADFTSLKLLDVGARVSAATLTTGSGWYQANITIDGKAIAVRFFADGTHATVQ